MAELVCAADDPRRLAERRGGVTATDMSVILGLATWNSPYGLWWDKTSPEPRKPVDTDRFRLGRMLKPYIVDRWQEEHPLGDWEIRSGCPGLLRSSDRPWQLATPDRLLLQLFPPHPPVFTAVLEVKSWADADRSSWEAGPPPVVRAQVLWQMDVMNVTSGHVGVVFLPSGEFRSYVIELCDESCGWREDIAFLREEGHEFYRRMTGELPPPSVDGSAATLAALRARFTPAEGPAADIPADLWDLFMEGKSAMGEGKRVKQEAEAKIREIAQGANRLKADGRIVARRITSTAEVTAHTRRQDYYRPVGSTADDD